MSSPDFSPATREILAFRASLICSNPRCSTLTVGPSDANGPLALKLGEAAHIHAARAGQARHIPSMTDDERSHPDNGIWLCANCHTMVDKNQGADFPAPMLLDWKRRHEEIIRSLLYSHRSPLPLLRKFTEEGQIAQDAVDLLEQHGALFVDRSIEEPQYMAVSLDRLRSGLRELAQRIRYDSQLKTIIKDLANECRSFMNHTSRFSTTQWNEVEVLRARVGTLVLRLRDEYRCRVHHLNRILPE